MLDDGLCPSGDRRRRSVSQVDVVGETDVGIGRVAGSQVKNGSSTYVAVGNQQQLGDGDREAMEVPVVPPTSAGTGLVSFCDPF